jgi:hypothetical protein
MSTIPATPSFIPPKVAAALAILATVATAAAAFVPAVAQPWLALFGFVLAGLAGIALPQLQVLGGKALVSPAVAGVIGSAGVGGLVEGLQHAVPHGWPQAMVYAGSAFMAILAGKALPSFAPAQAAGLEAAKDPGPVLNG